MYRLTPMKPLLRALPSSALLSTMPRPAAFARSASLTPPRCPSGRLASSCCRCRAACSWVFAGLCCLKCACAVLRL